MTRKSRSKVMRTIGSAILAVAVFGFITANSPRGVNAAVEIGSAFRVVGDVYGNNLNKRIQVGQRLIFNQRVRTGAESATDIIFFDDTDLMLGERSQVFLDDLVYDPAEKKIGGVFELVKGVLRFTSKVTNLDVKIRTKHATIGIRGTRFDLYSTSRRTEIAFHEGQVRVGSQFGSESVGPGQVYAVGAREALGFSDAMSPEMTQAVVRMTTLVASAEPGESQKAASESKPGTTQTARLAGRTTPELTKAIRGKNLENLVYLDLDAGRVVIELRPDVAPKHVARIKELVRKGFYDGLDFHNVRPGFVAETGDPPGEETGTGTLLKAEISNVTFERGTIGMKHVMNKPDTADSQFFIILGPSPHLDGKYTAWGRVIHGIEFADGLSRGSPPETPDKILTMRVAADVKE
ncbi:MAG: peptidylprolyl isomerase [Alphaproteobacteria bacterium]|nr:peptidylprolyl isomerase [Alphaproteobacteria bacterium]